jgi:hypothetical protein
MKLFLKTPYLFIEFMVKFHSFSSSGFQGFLSNPGYKALLQDFSNSVGELTFVFHDRAKCLQHICRQRSQLVQQVSQQMKAPL